MGNHLQCSEYATIYDQLYPNGSRQSLNFILSIPGIKACLKDAFTQQELMDALVIQFGVVTEWDKHEENSDIGLP
jgi:hypothetical protein